MNSSRDLKPQNKSSNSNARKYWGAAGGQKNKAASKARHLGAALTSKNTGKPKPANVTIERACLNGLGESIFQVQGQYLHCRIVSYFDYDSTGSADAIKQIYIDPQEVLPIFSANEATDETTGAEPVDIQVHALQPNVLTPFGPPAQETPIATASQKPLLVVASMPLQYPTGVGGTGFREFGWGKVTTQINPSNEPSWVPVFKFLNSDIPRGSVWGMTDTESNLCCGAFWVLEPDTFSQAICSLQFRVEIEVRVPLPNVNLARWTTRNVTGREFLDKVSTGENIPYAPCLTELCSVKRDSAGALANQIVDQLKAKELRNLRQASVDTLSGCRDSFAVIPGSSRSRR